MSSPVVSPLICLVVRVITLMLLVASLVVLVTNNVTYETNDDTDYIYGGGVVIEKFKFSDVYAYRYMLSVIIIGMTWILLQSGLTIYHLSSGKLLGGHVFVHVEFYCDKVISGLLGTGAAAGFGVSIEAKRLFDKSDSIEMDFLNKAIISASLLLVAFLFSLISSVFSSYNLHKK